MLRSNHYRKDQMYRNERIHEAEREHLAEKMAASKPSQMSGHSLHISHRLVALILLAGLLVVLSFLLPSVTHAQDQRQEDTGIIEPFGDAYLDYRMGHYNFVVGNYEQAVTKYQSAIDQIPAKVFEVSADYAAMYWDLGDAQQMAGQFGDALTSYQHYLELVGDVASEQAVAYVADLQTTLMNGTEVEVSLLSS